MSQGGVLSELIDENLSANALRTFSDAILCVFSFKAKLIDDLQEYLLAPLIQFSREDLKEMKVLISYCTGFDLKSHVPGISVCEGTTSNIRTNVR